MLKIVVLNYFFKLKVSRCLFHARWHNFTVNNDVAKASACVDGWTATEKFPRGPMLLCFFQVLSKYIRPLSELG